MKVPRRTTYRVGASIAAVILTLAAADAYVTMTLTRYYFREQSLLPSYVTIAAFSSLAVAAIVETIITIGWKRWSRRSAGAPN